MTSRELGERELFDTVKPYHRHALVCTGRTDWPPKLEEAEGLLGVMARDVRELRDGPGPIPKLTATDEPARGRPFDVLVFPEAVRYRGVDTGAWESILQEHLRGGRPAAAVPCEPLAGRWVFVCIHGARDERCGRCGPDVLEAMREACERSGLAEVTVRATSHVGGHKYAANMIVYPEGVWYGFVTPDDVPRIVRDHLVGDRIVEEIHRGSMITV
jgi:(2Fe-2S) ferredoxin